MKKELTAFIGQLKSGKKLKGFDEASTKQGVVLKLLSLLGWDVFDVEEVCPDFVVDVYSVSYALRIDARNRVLVAVRSAQEKLEGQQNELLLCAAQAGVDLCLLTNGAQWWFYLLTGRSQRRYRRYAICDFLKQKPEACANALMDFLGRAKVARGEALKSAREVYRRHKQKVAAEALPQAWNQLLSPPNKILVEILAEICEKLSGQRADSKLVEKFIAEHYPQWQLQVPEGFKAGDMVGPAAGTDTRAATEATEPAEAPERLESYANRRIVSYSFNGHGRQVNNWEEMLVSLCEFIAAEVPGEFEKVLWITHNRRPYFSTNADELRIPEKVRKTNIYVETKLNPDEIVKLADQLLAEFGHERAALEITVE